MSYDSYASNMWMEYSFCNYAYVVFFTDKTTKEPRNPNKPA